MVASGFSLKDVPGWVMAALALGSWPLGLSVEPEALLLGYVPSFVARSSVVQSVPFPHDLLPSFVGPACQLLSTSASHICSHLHVSEVFCVTVWGRTDSRGRN